MNKIRNGIFYLFTNPKRFIDSLAVNLSCVISDKLLLEIRYWCKLGRWPDLKKPNTYNEKIQWLKLYNRRPEYTMMVDKYAVKDYVAKKIGEEYVIPTLGVWDRPEDIDWATLPNKFVLKTTHGGGNWGVVICKDKNKFDYKDAIQKLNHSLRSDIYKVWGEWPYKNVQKRIIAEELIQVKPEESDLPDYKFFCFNGEVKALFVATDRQKKGEEVKFDFYDSEFVHLPIKQGHENAMEQPLKPHTFEKMKQIAAELSKGIPHVRIDLYSVGDKVYFGEMTFFHFSGLVPFIPEQWDIKFGNMLILPRINS